MGSGIEGLGCLRGLGRNLGGSVQAIAAEAGEEIRFLGLRYAKRQEKGM